jgi:hypothetical protein
MGCCHANNKKVAEQLTKLWAAAMPMQVSVSGGSSIVEVAVLLENDLSSRQ